MERNTTTTPDHLSPGDRFYKANDRKKTVLTLIEHIKKVTYFQTYKYWYRTDTDFRPVPIKADTTIIFLRHATTNTPQPATALP